MQIGLLPRRVWATQTSPIKIYQPNLSSRVEQDIVRVEIGMKYPFMMKPRNGRADIPPRQHAIRFVQAFGQCTRPRNLPSQEIRTIKQTFTPPPGKHRLWNRQPARRQLHQQSELAHAAGTRFAQKKIAIADPPTNQPTASEVPQDARTKWTLDHERSTPTAPSTQWLRARPGGLVAQGGCGLGQQLGVIQNSTLRRSHTANICDNARGALHLTFPCQS